MGLPVRQQRTLDEIEGRLAGSDPRLKSLFSIFSRLTIGEAMPWFENLRVRPIVDRFPPMRMWFHRVAGPPRVSWWSSPPGGAASTCCERPPSARAGPAGHLLRLVRRGRGGQPRRAAAARAGTGSQPSCFQMIVPCAETSANHGWS